MIHHPDPSSDRALIRLLDALCEWERNTGMRSTLIFVPHSPGEKIVLAQDGRPLQPSPGMGSKEILNIALRERGES